MRWFIIKTQSIDMVGYDILYYIIYFKYLIIFFVTQFSLQN